MWRWCQNRFFFSPNQKTPFNLCPKTQFFELQKGSEKKPSGVEACIFNIFSFVIGITTCTYGYPNLGFGLSSKGVCGAIGNFNQCLNEGFPNSNFTLCNIANIDSYILVSCCLLTIETTNKCKSSIQTRLIEVRNHIEERYSNTENQYPTVEATYPTTEIEQVTDTPDHQNI